MVMEADQQLKEAGIDRPTHVFVQAGVGSLAGAVVGYLLTNIKKIRRLWLSAKQALLTACIVPP